MTYNLLRLNPTEFEYLVQSLSRAMLGNGSLSFGKGPDGGRELTFTGKAPYPGPAEQWEGYWVVQAKFKQDAGLSSSKDIAWLLAQLEQEFKTYATRQTKVDRPDNYLFFTNIELSAVARTGGIDIVQRNLRIFEKKYKVKHIAVISANDITELLRANRQIAISFSPFILPGDVFAKLLTLLDFSTERAQRLRELFNRFLEMEFLEDAQSKLEHAGKLTNDRVNLEKVFIDLRAEYQRGNGIYIIDDLLRTDLMFTDVSTQNAERNVLIGGPGQGKSTLVQFLAQIHRGFFLSDTDTITPNSAINEFIADYDTIMSLRPRVARFPLKVILKEYAAWIEDTRRQDNNASISVLSYLISHIRRKTGSELIGMEEIEKLLSGVPSLFIFDGLDEVPVSSNRQHVLSEINTFTNTILRRMNANSQIIATSRPQGYSADFDQITYRHLYLSDLEPKDCASYLSRLLPYMIDRQEDRDYKYKILLKALDDPNISRVMRSPLQASIMAILVKIGGDPPTNKFELFKDYFHIIYQRERQRNIAQVLSDRPNYVRDIHYHLGLHLQAISEERSNPAAMISKEKFENLVADYLRHKGQPDSESQRLTREIVDAATERLVFIDEPEAGKVGFAIRSIQEYFAALGFVQGVVEAPQRIQQIAGNAYWSNTFLFIAGYAADQAQHLIPSVTGLCYELNGSGDKLEDTGLGAYSAFGSWLALDLLLENVFRDHVTVENTLARLLEPLFQLPAESRHHMLTYLPDRLLNTWILPFIEKTLEANACNSACWKVWALLRQKGLDSEAMLRLLPVDLKQRWKVLVQILNQDHYNATIFNEVEKLIVPEMCMEILDLMIYMRHNDFLGELIDHLRSEKARILIFEAFIIQAMGISQRQISFMQSFYTYTKLSKHEEPYNVFYRKQQHAEVSFHTDYSYTITRTAIKYPKELEEILLPGIQLGSKLVSLLYDFLIAPDHRRYQLFITYLRIYPLEFRQAVKTRLGRLNSFFAATLRGEPADEKEFKLLLKAIDQSGTTELRLYPEKKIEYEHYASHYNLNTERFEEVCIFFCEEYLGKDLLEPTALAAFRNLLLNGAERGIARLRRSERFSFLQPKIKAAMELNRPVTFRFTFPLVRWITVFELLDLPTIHGIVNKHADTFQEMSLIFHAGEFIQSNFTGNDLMELLIKMAQIVNRQIVLEEKPAYRMLFQTIIYCDQGLEVPEVFKNCIADKDNPDVYRLILLLFDLEFGALHLNAIQNLLKTANDQLRSEEVQQALVYALNRTGNNIDLDQTLAEMIVSVPFTPEHKADFTEFVYNYLSSRPTGVKEMRLEEFGGLAPTDQVL